MLCVVVLEVEDGDFSDLKGSALDVHSSVIVANSRETREESSQLDRSSAEPKFTNKSASHGFQTTHQVS